MDARETQNCTAFLGAQKIAAGSAEAVATALKAATDRDPPAFAAAYDDETAHPLEFDLRGSEEDVRSRYASGPRKAGRPRLGVTSREVTLLPRQWDWLAAHPGGASAVLRRLVDQARTEGEDADRARAAQEAAYRFMSAALGDQPGFEEASRALFACDGERFDDHAAAWPRDLADYARRLAAPAFAPTAVALRAGKR